MTTSRSLENSVYLRWLLLAVLVLGAYFPVIANGEFIWDDDFYVTENQQLDDFGGLIRIWTDPSSIPQYYPVTHTTFWIEHQLWGEAAMGYRVVNALLHVLNAILLYAIVARMRIPGALLVAFVFALHPIEVESVAWITERKNVLSFFFFLLSLRQLLMWQQSKDSSKHFNWAFLFFLLAMGSKTVVATLPAVFLVICWYKRDDLKLITLKMIPFFVVSVVGSVATSLIEARSVGASGWEWDLSILERIMLAGRIPFFYIQKLLWPTDLCFNYFRWDPAVSAVAVAFLTATCSILGLGWAIRRRWGRGVLASFLIFGGMLFPALGFINVYPMRYSFVADHFQYHAGAAFLVLIAALVTLATKALPSTARTFLNAMLIGVLTFSTYTYSQTFVRDEAIWNRVLQVNPQSWMAYDNLANLRRKEGQPLLALEAATSALALNSEIPETWTSYAFSLEQNGEQGKALNAFAEAASRAPRDPRTRLNLGLAMYKSGFLEPAEKELRAALLLQPNASAAMSALGAVLLRSKRHGEAEEMLLEVCQHPDAHGRDFLNLATLYKIQDRNKEHQEALRSAVRVSPGFGPAWRGLCFYAYDHEQWNEAEDALNKVRASGTIDPKLEIVSVFLAGVKQGTSIADLKAASATGQRLLEQLKFSSPEAVEALAVVYAALGEYAAAIFLVEEGARIAEQRQNLNWNSRLLARAAKFRNRAPLILYGK
ncbi:MAG: tetratricopeptide (TPR) repeat protein [Planctomycetota bacterium]|jgi:tetratricopeptide (TPR) repeat protein